MDGKIDMSSHLGIKLTIQERHDEDFFPAICLSCHLFALHIATHGFRSILIKRTFFSYEGEETAGQSGDWL